MLTTVPSADNTRIACTRRGDGPALVLVTGTLDDGAETDPLAEALADRFTTCNLHRRGRGGSGEASPHTLERELEDLDAVIAAAGGRASLYGVSTGGAVVLEAAAAGLPVDRVAVYEVPYMTDEPAERAWLAYVSDVRAALAEGRRGDAVERFMLLAGVPPDDIAAARASEHWARAEALAHTLGHDATCLGDGRPPAERLGRIRCPALVVTGGGGGPLFEAAADAIVAAVPDAKRHVLAGQGHVVDPGAMATLLRRFLA